MKAVATYFAEVGFRVRQKDITEVNKALTQMRRDFVNFNKTLRSYENGLNINARISPSAFSFMDRQLKSFEKRIKPLSINTNKIKIPKSGKALERPVTTPVENKWDNVLNESVKKMNDTLKQIRKVGEDGNKELKKLSSAMTSATSRRGGGIGGGGGGFSGVGIGAAPSRRRGTDLGRRTTFGVTQSATTNASSGVGSTGLSRRSSSPFHNPLMVGGFTGSLTRYGLYALPFFGGAIGFNALSQLAEGAEKQRTSLDYAASISGTGLSGDRYRDFLDSLGYEIGMSSDSMVDSFTYMLSSLAGSRAESELERGFTSMTKLSTVLGHTQQQQDASLKAITKMLTDPKMTASQLKGTPADNIPHIMTLAAEALAGGNMDELIRKLDDKEIDPARDMPKIYAEIDRTIQPYLEEYYNSIRFSKNESQRLKDKWMADFLEGGGADAAKGIYDTLNYIMGDGSGGARVVGNFVSATSDLVSAAMLAPKEAVDYIKGLPDAGNILTHFIGEREVGDFLDSAGESLKLLRKSYSTLVDTATSIRERFGKPIGDSAIDTVTSLARATGRVPQYPLTWLSGVVEGKRGMDLELETDTLQARHAAEDLARARFPDWQNKSYQDQKDIIDVIVPHITAAISNGFDPANPNNRGWFSRAFSSPSENREEYLDALQRILVGSLPDPQSRFLFEDDKYIDEHGYRSQIIPSWHEGDPPAPLPEGFLPVSLAGEGDDREREDARLRRESLRKPSKGVGDWSFETPRDVPHPKMSPIPQEYLDSVKESTESLLDRLLSTPRPINSTINQEVSISLSMVNEDNLSMEEVGVRLQEYVTDSLNVAMEQTVATYISGMA